MLPFQMEYTVNMLNFTVCLSFLEEKQYIIEQNEQGEIQLISVKNTQ